MEKEKGEKDKQTDVIVKCSVCIMCVTRPKYWPEVAWIDLTYRDSTSPKIIGKSFTFLV